jgi:hypothetical protein
MIDDEIVAEVRKHRQEYAAQFGFDLRAIAEDARKSELASGRRLVSFVKKTARHAARAGQSKRRLTHGNTAKQTRSAPAAGAGTAGKK